MQEVQQRIADSVKDQMNVQPEWEEMYQQMLDMVSVGEPTPNLSRKNRKTKGQYPSEGEFYYKCHKGYVTRCHHNQIMTVASFGWIEDDYVFVSKPLMRIHKQLVERGWRI